MLVSVFLYVPHTNILLSAQQPARDIGDEKVSTASLLRPDDDYPLFYCRLPCLFEREMERRKENKPTKVINPANQLSEV